MFGSEILDVALGLVFVYIILSIITTTVMEFIARWFELRSTNLRDGISHLLNDLQETGIAKDFFEHPLIKGMSRPGGKTPSYIPSDIFVKVLLDVLANDKSASDFLDFDDIKKLRDYIRDSNLLKQNPDLKKQLEVVLGQVDRVQEAQLALARWFDNSMNSVSEKYRKHSEFIVIVIAIAVTILTNADTLFIVNRLNSDPTVREAVVASANQLVDETAAAPENGASPTMDRIVTLQGELTDTFGLLGWTNTDGTLRLPDSTSGWITKSIGYFLTVVALAQGAPFWFNIVRNIMELRSGKLPEEKASVSAEVKTPSSSVKIEAKEEGAHLLLPPADDAEQHEHEAENDLPPPPTSVDVPETLEEADDDEGRG